LIILLLINNLNFFLLLFICAHAYNCFKFHHLIANIWEGASPCTSNTSSVPPKVTIMPFIKIQLRVVRDAVNFIYCVANFCTPKYYFFSVCLSLTLSSFKISQFHSRFVWSLSQFHSRFILLSFQFCVLHSFIVRWCGPLLEVCITFIQFLLSFFSQCVSVSLSMLVVVQG